MSDDTRVRAWRPQVPGVTEVFHAQMTSHVYPMHTHESWTLLIVDDGIISYDLDRHEHGALDRVVTLLPPDVPHNGRAATPAGFRKRVAYLDHAQLPASLIGRAADRPVLSDPLLRHRIHLLHRVLEEPGEEFEAESRLAFVAERLMHHLDQRDDDSGTAARGADVAHQLRELIDARFREKLTLRQASDVLHAHPAHLVRMFSREFGISPHQYMTGRRVDRARRLLLDGMMPSLAAADVGFCDQSHLSRHFKRVLGTSPGRYARSGQAPGHRLSERLARFARLTMPSSGRNTPGSGRKGRQMRRVAVLGTGIMGAGMARSLLRAGLDVSVWNRSAGRAEPLAADGAQVAGTAAEAVADADAVVTMLWDGDSVAGVMTEALPAAPAGVAWAQTSTVSPHDAGDRLPALAADHGARYIDAPVLGTRQPAEEGKLLVLAAAPDPVRAPVTPLFDAIAARTVWVSERPGDGTRLKLAVNSWVGTIVAATAQAIAFTQGLGLDPRAFLDTVQGSAVDTPFVHLKGEAMISGQFPPAFTVDGAVKDTGLIAAAMRAAGTDTALIDAVARQYRKAAGSGHGGEDMAAVIRAFQP